MGNDDLITFLDDSRKLLEHLYCEGLKEGRELFPDHPRAQEVWARLCSSRGGIEIVVNTLGLQDTFMEYLEDFKKCFDHSSGELISMKIEGFVRFCKSELKENFYLFK